MEERYCQSCGMPMGQGDGLYGTEADGGKSADYCKYCYDKGAFTFHGTMEEMIEICVPPMVQSNQGMTPEPVSYTHLDVYKRQMLLHAAQLLEAHSETINNMNVFPVPDGDTGSNMTMTIQGVFQVPFTPEMPLGDCAAKAAEAMLRSARGNSGVILSVFFRGVGRALKGKTAATAADLAAGFAVGAESAYGAVMNPTEGTILTVMRAAADCAKQVAKLDPESDLEAFFAAVLTAADGALQKTPDLLPKLKEAGVVLSLIHI